MSASATIGALVAVTMLATARPAAAAPVFSWRVPEQLTAETPARSVDAAAAAPSATIVLRTCSVNPKWTLDGGEVAPAPDGRCQYRLDLGDHKLHKLALEAGGEKSEQEVQARDLVIVSIGDSVASGEGSPDNASLVNPQWLQRACHRSMRSGAAQAALALAVSDPHSAITFLPLGCSGATIPTGLLNAYAGVQPDSKHTLLPAQVEQVAELQHRRPIDAVLVTIGANDVHFGSIVQFCIFTQPCNTRHFDPGHPRSEASGRPSAEAVEADALRELPGRYDTLAQALEQAGIDADRVIISQYHDPTRGDDGQACTHTLPGISVGENEWAEDAVIAPLNEQVRNAAQKHGWKLVAGVPDAFAAHGLCSATSWIRTLEGSVLRGAGLEGPLHPNSAGHLAIAALIAPVLANALQIDPGQAVAQTSGQSDDEAGRLVPWWALLLIGAVVGAGAGAAIVLTSRLGARRSSAQSAPPGAPVSRRRSAA